MCSQIYIKALKVITIITWINSSVMSGLIMLSYSCNVCYTCISFSLAMYLTAHININNHKSIKLLHQIALKF